MKRAEEFSSIIENPETISRLKRFLDELTKGASLEESARKAQLSGSSLKELAAVLRRRLDRDEIKAPRVRDSDKGGRAERGRVILFADGASRGNPGEASCAAVLKDGDGTTLAERAEKIGRATNNVAEYRGVILALRLAETFGAAGIALKLDSELVVKQLKGIYKVKNANLKILHQKARALLSGFSAVSIEHVSRDENIEADNLANRVLDGKL